MKRVGKIWWDEGTIMYTPEGEVRNVYSGSVDGSKEDGDVLAGRYCIFSTMECTWWV